MSPRRRASTPTLQRRLAVVRRAREALPSLSTDQLRVVQDLLERALADPDIDPEVVRELERLVDADG